MFRMKTDMMPGATGTQNGNTGDISILNAGERGEGYAALFPPELVRMLRDARRRGFV